MSVTAEQVLEALRQSDGNKTKAAEILGLPRTTYRRLLSSAQSFSDELEEIEEPVNFVSTDTARVKEDKKDDSVIVEYSPGRFKSIEEIIAWANIDTKFYEIPDQEFRFWDTAMKLGEKGQETVFVNQNQYFSVRFRRKISRNIQEIFQPLLEEMKKYSPTLYVPNRSDHGNRTKLGVMSCSDQHFGKLGWQAETGQPWDLSICSGILQDSVDNILDDMAVDKIGRWLFPVGNDFFHFDNLTNTTTGGTPQHTDSRFHKVMVAGQVEIVKVIDKLRSIAPVDVVWVPGNHDRQTSFHLCQFISAYFRHDDGIKVDCRPMPRKYYKWGKCLFPLMHGDCEKEKDLPSIVLAEARSVLSEVKFIEAFLGHLHTKRETNPISLSEKNGFVIRRMPSLTACDAWHKMMGYFGNLRQAECYIYDKEYGHKQVINSCQSVTEKYTPKFQHVFEAVC